MQAGMELQRHYRHLLDRHGNGELSRRAFLGHVARMALACGVMAPALTRFALPARAAQSVRYDGFGGYSQEAFDRLVLKPFTEKTGIAVTQGSYPNADVLLAQMQTEGYQHYNFFWAAQEITPIQVARRGWNAEIDETKIPRLKDLAPSVLERARQQGKGRLLAIPYCLSGGFIAYNTKSVERAEVESKGFDILLDPKFQKNTGGVDNWQQRMMYGALQTGQDINNIADLDAVWNKVRESKRQVLKYFTSGAEQTTLLSSGNIALADAWFVPVYNMIKKGLPIDYWPRQGSYVQLGAMVALKGSPMDALYEMVDILLGPDVSFALALATGNLPLLDPIKHEFPKDVQAIPGYDPAGTFAGYRFFEPAYWEEKGLTWQRDYARVMARG
jgi:spermidine/putrescine transport system substrate-binding protein